MFRVNGMQIMMTAGDTGLLAVILDEEGYVPTAEDRAVFTARLRPGSYVWDIRFALEAAVDAKGKVTACREVITPCAPGRMDIVDALKEG